MYLKGGLFLYGWWEKHSEKGKSQSNGGIVAADPCRMGKGRTKLCTMGTHNNPGSANLGQSAVKIMRRGWSNLFFGDTVMQVQMSRRSVPKFAGVTSGGSRTKDEIQRL